MVWWLPIIISLIYWVYYERIMFAEEAFLRCKFGEEYTVWASNTPAFIPDFSKWVSSDLNISYRTIIKREYTGLFGIITLSTILHFVGDFFGVGLVLYVSAVMLKKKTKILHVRGR